MLGANTTRLLSLASVLAAWEVISRALPVGIRFLLPGPSRIAISLYEITVSGELRQALVLSLGGMAVGYLLALLIGVPLGILMGIRRSVEYALDIHVNALYVTPLIALVPIMIFWFGLGLVMRVVFILIFCVFHILITTYHGAKSVSERLVEVARSFCASERDLFTKVIIPHISPFIVAAARLGLGMALRGMVGAEILIASTGLGGLITLYSASLSLDKVLAVAVVLMLLGIGLTEAVKRVEAALAPWRAGFGR